MPNKLLHTSAKQRLSYHVALFPLACVYSVSPRVISTVQQFFLLREETIMTTDKIKDNPRRQHYHFAHVYLRDRAFGNAKLLIDELSKDDSAEFLKIRWILTGFNSKDAEDDFITNEGLEAFPFKVGNDFYGVLVQLPKPERIAEAYFAAIILSVDADTSTACRFYTLEFSKRDDGSHNTVLGEWVGKGTHFNLGPGPAPEQQAFIDAIKEKMSKQPKIGEVRT